MTTAIATCGLVKTFGPTRALDGLDLTVEAGEVHGFLGPNGAGKFTAIRVLLGFLRADSGQAQVFGGDPWNDAVALHRRLAYVPGDVELWPDLTGGEAIDLLGQLRGGLNQARRVELIERFDLDPTKQGRTYSKGNRQKVAIVAALAADSELLVLASPPAMAESMQRRIVGWLTVRRHDSGAHPADIAVGRVSDLVARLGVEIDAYARCAISSRQTVSHDTLRVDPRSRSVRLGPSVWAHQRAALT